MTVEPVYDALGYRFSVRCANPSHSGEVAALLEGFGSRDVSADHDVLSLPDGEHSSDALAALIGTINLRAVHVAQGRLLLHAGAVCRQNGDVTILCGPSGSGKSTLTAELVARGHAYVTDETVCLSPERLTVTTFRKPISLKPGSQPHFPALRPEPGSLVAALSEKQWLVAPNQVGSAEVPAGHLWPQLLVFPTYEAGATQRIERLSAAEAAYLMGANTSRLLSVTGGALAVLARMSRRVRTYRLIHGDHPTAAAASIEALWSAAA